MNESIIASALGINEIFEKSQNKEIIKILSDQFGEPKVSTEQSGDTTMSGHTISISEKKWVWEIRDFSRFYDLFDEDSEESAVNPFETFQDVIQRVFLIGLYCEELPYFQVVIYIQFSLKTHNTIINNSAKLAIPFQRYLQSLNGLSSVVYQEEVKPRLHMHHIIHSSYHFDLGFDSIRNLRQMQQQDKQYESRPTEYSKNLRELPILRELPYPTILSSINLYHNLLALITHYEQFGNGRELQTCGITVLKDLHDNPEKIINNQNPTERIKMFSPNLNIFDFSIGAINLHLFISGLLTWLSYFEITRLNLSKDLDNKREKIQSMLNTNNIQNITILQPDIAILQGHFASMALLLSAVKNQIIEPITDLSTRTGLIGTYQIPIPQNSLPFAHVLGNRIGNPAYFELVASRIKNNFDTIAEKLMSIDNPTNRMNNFLYNQNNLKLQKAINKNSSISLALSFIIGGLAAISAFALLF